MTFRKTISALASLAVLLPGIATAQIASNPMQPNFINLLDNGNFNIAQRSTTTVSSITTTAKYLQDRWATYSGTATSASMSNVTTPLPTGFSNATQVQRTSGQTGVLPVCLVQEIPTSDITPLAGQPVTLSFWATAGANFSASSSNLTLKITTGTGTDEGLATLITGFTGAAQAVNALQPITTTWQRYAVTGTLAANTTEAAVQICFTPIGTAGTSDYFQATGVQLERGTTPSNFEWRAAGVELAKVQRYYWQIADGAATVPYPSSCFVTAANTTVKCGVTVPVTMRAAPTTTVGTATSFGIVVTAGTAGTCTTLAATASSNTVNSIGVTCTTGGTIALGSATPLIGAATGGILSASADF